VNFVSKDRDGRWRVRTYERGVEAETLACGTGSVATAILLEAWGLGGSETALETRSGRTLTVTIRGQGSARSPSLRGEGRLVFVGELRDV
jgi:diaminopimelate epimerase